MKDEEMADKLAEELEKKAIDVIRNQSHKLIDNFTQEDLENREISIFLAGYHEGLKAGRPQWHDLRKDKNDLPKDTTSLYLVRVYSWDFGLSHLYKKYGTYIPTVCEWNGEYFEALDRMAYSNVRNINNCIAWCEIPTFGKE